MAELIGEDFRVTRQHRTAYVLLLDMSSSMSEVIDFEGRKMTKEGAVAKVATEALQELYLRAFRDGKLRDYYDVAVVAYSGSGVVSLLTNDYDESIFVPISRLNIGGVDGLSLKVITPLDPPENVRYVADGVVELSPQGSTPMYDALYTVCESVEEWCGRAQNYHSLAPTVINISDGHATDCDLDDIIDISRRLGSISTGRGNTLMLNVHLSSMVESAPMIFPTDAEIAEHRNPFFRAMGYASSVMPQYFTPLIEEVRGGRGAERSYRGVGCNLSVVDLISMINIGTLSVNVG